MKARTESAQFRRALQQKEFRLLLMHGALVIAGCVLAGIGMFGSLTMMRAGIALTMTMTLAVISPGPVAAVAFEAAYLLVSTCACIEWNNAHAEAMAEESPLGILLLIAWLAVGVLIGWTIIARQDLSISEERYTRRLFRERRAARSGC